MPFNIWFKYDESQPAKIKLDGEDVDDLKEAIKKKLEPKLNDVSVDDIALRKHGEDVDLEPDSLVEETFGPSAWEPLKVVVTRGK